MGQQVSDKKMAERLMHGARRQKGSAANKRKVDSEPEVFVSKKAKAAGKKYEISNFGFMKPK